LNAFLPKPIDFERLLDRIEPLLDLRWIHAPMQQSSPHESWRHDLVEAPPPDEMDVLYTLARLGNMQNILERADYLNGLDLRYRPFAEHLRKMASSFQSKAITGFIEQHLKIQQEQSAVGWGHSEFRNASEEAANST
jgi:hypothetical protein